MDKEGFKCIEEGGVRKIGKGLKLLMKWSFDDDGLYKLISSTLISSVCEATPSTKHVDDDVSIDGISAIPISPKKSMDFLDLWTWLVINHTLL